MTEMNLQDDDDLVEEEGPDWRMLNKLTSKGEVEAFIPRRGEKDFEPLKSLEPIQLQALQDSRHALFSALSVGLRGHSSRDHVRCIWNKSNENQIESPYVDGIAKGVLFSSMGRWNRIRKKLELSPEELLYLIERGYVESWSNYPDTPTQLPMSVQQSWAEIIGTDHLSLEKYQVYAYLKRLGYIVLRKEHVDSIWESQSQSQSPKPFQFNKPISYLGFFLNSLSKFLSWPFTKLKNYFKQIHLLLFPSDSSSNLICGKKFKKIAASNRFLIYNKTFKNYESIFNSLRIIPSGSKVSWPKNQITTSSNKDNQGYQIFYYVYKPNNRFPKSAPPSPDFQVCVVDAETMPIPTISIIHNLLDTLRTPSSPSNLNNQKSLFHFNYHFLTSFFFKLFNLWGSSSTFIKKKSPPRQNIFSQIKRGQRDVLLAVVDHGVISFLKFFETDFGKFPLVGSKSKI